MKRAVAQMKNIFRLTTYEAMLYVAALNYQEINISDLAKASGIPRTAAYQPLQSLLDHGFVETINTKKRIMYRALKPGKLQNILLQKQAELAEMVENIEDNIKVPEQDLEIKYFNGRSGVTKALEIINRKNKPKNEKSWRSLLENNEKFSIKEEYVKDSIIDEIFCSDDYKIAKRFYKNIKNKREKKLFVNFKKFPLKTSIKVIDDMVMFYTTGQNPFAVLIKNKDVAMTMWNIHQMVMDEQT